MANEEDMNFILPLSIIAPGQSDLLSSELDQLKLMDDICDKWGYIWNSEVYFTRRANKALIVLLQRQMHSNGFGRAQAETEYKRSSSEEAHSPRLIRIDSRCINVQSFEYHARTVN
ncbi:hypothetical protein EJB05_56199, partial [Eragrostis curvula]